MDDALENLFKDDKDDNDVKDLKDVKDIKDVKEVKEVKDVKDVCHILSSWVIRRLHTKTQLPSFARN